MRYRSPVEGCSIRDRAAVLQRKPYRREGETAWSEYHASAGNALFRRLIENNVCAGVTGGYDALRGGSSDPSVRG